MPRQTEAAFLAIRYNRALAFSLLLEPAKESPCSWGQM